MGLFTKKLGPVSLKEGSSLEEYISKLEILHDKAVGEQKARIEKQITIARYGMAGESSISFELKNSGMDMYILHDIYLEYGDLSAQIDYIVVTRKRIYVLECKNLIGNIEVDNKGNFIRNYEVYGRKIREGIYSPITQNERHLNVIKLLRKESKSNFITKKIFENAFADTYKSLIVLANPKTVLNDKFAKKEVKEKIVRADQLINTIKEMDRQSTDYTFNDKDMLEIAHFYLGLDRPNKSDYMNKYEELLTDMEKTSDNQDDDLAEEIAIEETVNTEKTTEDVLVARLKVFRSDQSRREKIKPYYIFNDAQMEDLISKHPKTKEELLKVSGFGSKKVEKYGDAILMLLNE